LPRHDDPVERTRRFYKSVDVAERDGAFVVRLDGRLPRSPEGRPLSLPTPALAELVAGEWAAQGEYIMPPSMPATRLAWTTIDRAGAARAELAAEVARYAGSDLLCYFAEGPDELVRRQEASWTPLIGWAEAHLGLEFRRAQGIVHQPQPEATLDRVRALAARTDDFTLTGLAFAAALFGSAILAFALQRGQLDAKAAFALAHLDETFQQERWGVDAEAAERAEALAGDAQMLERWFAALR
jgi:chaperone required for assembly of F1-ATPase